MSNSIFNCLYDRVLIQVLDGRRESGDFVLPDSAREEFKMGTVYAVGNGYRAPDGSIHPLILQPGMIVVFGPHAGTPVKIAGQDYLSMKEAECVGWMDIAQALPPESARPEEQRIA